MSLNSISVSNASPVDITSLLAEADSVNRDQMKAAKIQRQLLHEKNMHALDDRIGSLKGQQEQTKKGGFFNFILGIVSQFLNLVTQVLNFVLPGSGPLIAGIVNGALQGGLQQAGNLNPHTQKANEAAIEAEKFQKQAQDEQNRYQIENEHLNIVADSRRISNERMEKALYEMQQAKNAAVRV